MSITRTTTDQRTPLFQVSDGASLTVTTSTGADNLLSYSNQKAPFLRVLEGASATIAHGAFSGNEADYGPVLQNGYEYYTPKVKWETERPANYEDNWTVDWQHGGTATISGGIYQGNKATASYFGGGVVYSYLASDAASTTISGGTFTGNSSAANGVYARGEEHYDPYRHLSGASGAHGGGVLYSRQGNVTISGGVFTGNRAENMNKDGMPRNNYGGGGGVLYIANESEGKTPSHLTISGGTFGGEGTGEGNASTGTGGAVFVAWHVEGDVLGGSFLYNECYGMGGAIYSEDTSTVTYAASAAWDNHAGHFGGGLWLCPSGMGVTSKTGNIALFDNTADVTYDQVEETRKYNGAAGDDFALMYPLKREVPSNSYLLSNSWFNGVSSVTWYEDGQPNYKATGFGDFTWSAFGAISLADSFKTNASVPRYDAATNPTLVPEQRIVLTRHNPANDAVDHGIALKAKVNEGVDVDFVKEHAAVKFVGNVAGMSGGAIGTNGNVVFGNNSIAEWEKVDANDGSALAGSSWTITGASGYSVKQADDYVWVGAADAQKANRWTQAADGTWTAVVEDNTGQADYHGYDDDPEPGKFLLGNLSNNTEYQIREKTAPAGYDASSTTYGFTTGSGHGASAPQLHVVGGGNVGNNAIGNTPSPSIPVIELKAHKTLAGGTLAAGKFSFDLSEREGSSAPYTYRSVETGATNAADGSVAFQPLTFTAPGEHVYRVSEQVPADATKNPDGTLSKDGVTYDQTGYYVKVTVSWGWKDADGRPVPEGTAGAVKNLVASVSYFSDEACTQPIDGAAYPDYVLEFTNRATTGWQFTKVDGSGGTAAPLAGAQFKLFRLADGATDADDVLDPDNPGASWTLAGEATSSDGTGGAVAGLVSFQNLTSGTYRLVETKAPSSDYVTPSGQWVVTVDTTAAGDAAHPKVSVTKTVGATPPAFKDNGDGTQSLPNYKGMTLPISGSSGTWLSAGIGAALIVSALITAIVRRKEFR